MTNQNDIPWKRISVEGLAIVVSILLAFWIDAWWDDRQERKVERTILISLLEGFSNLQNQFEYYQSFNESVHSATNKLIDASLHPDGAFSEEDVSVLLSNLWYFMKEDDWSFAALDSLIASGKIALISNDELRYDLGSWPAIINSVKNVSRRDEMYYHNNLMPFLIKNAQLAQIGNVPSHYPGHPELPYNPSNRYMIQESYDHSEMISSREFLNLMIEKATKQEDSFVTEAPVLEKRLKETTALIKQEVDR